MTYTEVVFSLKTYTEVGFSLKLGFTKILLTPKFSLKVLLGVKIVKT